MNSLRTALSSTAIVAVLGVGFGLWFALAPGEGERSLKAVPKSNPMMMEEMRKRNVLVMQVLKDAAQSQDNMAREQGGPVK